MNINLSALRIRPATSAAGQAAHTVLRSTSCKRPGIIGVVAQVVIQPEERLVTHVVVRSNEIKDGNLVARVYIVPVKDIDLVNNESILLGWNGLSLCGYPAFDPDEYLLALFTWKAPCPYTAGEVLWSLLEVLEAGAGQDIGPK